MSFTRSIILSWENSFNANCANKTSSVSLQHCAQYRLLHSVCVTSVPHKPYIVSYQVIMHRLERVFRHFAVLYITHTFTNYVLGDKLSLMNEVNNRAKG
jgi:hypothetical protein